MSAQFRVEVLGGVRAVVGARVIDCFQTQKVAALLARLAFGGGRLEAREALVEALWPGAVPERGRQNLRQTLFLLRRQLGPAGGALRATRGSIGLDAAVKTDLSEFEAALRAGRGGGAEALAALERAIALYGGEACAGLLEDWVCEPRERLRAAFLDAVARAVRALEECDPARALEYARRGIEADPLREAAWRDVIRLELALGRPAAARESLARLERMLAVDLAAGPAFETRALAREVERALRAPAAAAVPAAMARPPATPAAPSDGPLAGIPTVLLADGPVPPEAAEGGEALPSHGGASALAFARPADAARAAIRARGGTARIALDTGEAGDPAAGGPGPALAGALALLRAAHPGQVLASERTAALLARAAGPPVWVARDLGRFRLGGPGDAPERIYELRAPGDASPPSPPPRARPARPLALPPRFTRFFGREAEIARIRSLLLDEGARLVTLTGPGGAGKTRLALEAAARLADEFAQEVLFVALADVAGPGAAARIAGALAEALGLGAETGRPALEAAAEALSTGPALVVLDNLEQAIGPAAAAVRALLERAPDLRILATSRAPLEIEAERELPLAPLAPSEGIALFADRAQAVRPDFALTPRNRDAIAALCRHLDGLPLALELAAGRAQALAPEEIVARLGRTLDVLATRRRDVPARHRTLRAAIEWSVRLLSADDARFFACLSIFPGSFDAAAAGAVGGAADAAGALESLRAAALIQREGSPAAPRFRLLETVRSCAAEHVPAADRPALARRFAEHFLAVAEAAGAAFAGPEQLAALDRLSAEAASFRAALAWASGPGGDATLGLRIALALRPYWRTRGRADEALRAVEPLLSAPGLAPALRGRGLSMLGALAGMAGDGRAVPLLEEAATILRGARDDAALRPALTNLTTALRARGEVRRALDAAEEALAVARRLEDRAGIGVALANLATAAEDVGDLIRAEAAARDAIAAARAAGDEENLAYALRFAASVAMVRGRYEATEPLLAEARLLAERLGDRRQRTWLSLDVATLARMRGESAGARASARTAIDAAEEIGDQVASGFARLILGLAALDEGDPAAARDAADAVLRVFRRLQFRPGLLRALYLRASALGRLGERDLAMGALAEALAIARDTGTRSEAPELLDAGATLFAADGDARSAALLTGAADALREATGAAIPPVDRPTRSALLAALEARLGAGGLADALAEGRSLDLAQAVAIASGAARAGGAAAGGRRENRARSL